jgi:hypothetical protein
MHRLIRGAAVTVAFVLSASPVAAGDFGAGAVAGTLGLGAEAGYRFNPYLGLRAGLYAFRYDTDGEQDGIDYDVELELANAGAYLDWHPFGGGFRVSGGVVVNDNSLTGTGRPDGDGNYTIGGVTFTAAEVGALTGEGSFDSAAPYLGLGWVFGAREGRGLTVSLDAGVVVQGSLDVALDSTGGTLSGDPALQAALAAEEAELEDDIDGFDLYPVLALGVGYRF